MRVAIVGGLIGVLFIGLLPALAGEEVVVKWWGTIRPREPQAVADIHYQLAEAFMASHPGIKVEVSIFPSKGFKDRVATAIAAGQGPDIWYTYYVPEIAEEGFLEDLTPYMERDGVDPNKWFPIGRIRALYKGHYFGLPRDATAAVIAYNKDIFDAAGIPYPEAGWTIWDYRYLANVLTDHEAGIYGAGGIAGDVGIFMWSPFAYNLGAEFVSPDGRKVQGYLDSPEAIAALKFGMDLTAVDKVTPPPGLRQQFGELIFLSGKVAMQIVSTWELPPLREKAKFAWAVVEPPRFSKESTPIAWTDSYVYYLWSGSKHKEAAWEFLKFLVSPEAQKMASHIWTPVIPAVWVELGWDKDELLRVFWKELHKETRVPNYLRSRYFWECVYPAFEHIWTNYVELGKNRDYKAFIAMVKKETADAQKCLDLNYGG